MFRFLRTAHKWGGLIASLFLLLIAITGFFLATKSYWGFIRPPEAKAAEVSSFEEVIPVSQAVSAAFSVGIPELKEKKDIDRVDYRPKSNIFKVLSKKGYHEVQVDGKTGEVLSVAIRNDQIIEHLHDFQFFSELLNKFWLPVVAVILATLAITGVYITVNPMLRRAKFHRDQAKKSGPTPKA